MAKGKSKNKVADLHPEFEQGSSTGATNFEESAAIERARADLLQDKQRQLEHILDKHDDLLRESFHLEKFVTLVSYDPKVAKEDNSSVFLQYKEPHDLLAITPTNGSNSARKTRKGISERRESLKAPVSPQTPLYGKSTSKPGGRAVGVASGSPKGKGKARDESKSLLPDPSLATDRSRETARTPPTSSKTLRRSRPNQNKTDAKSAVVASAKMRSSTRSKSVATLSRSEDTLDTAVERSTTSSGYRKRRSSRSPEPIPSKRRSTRDNRQNQNRATPPDWERALEVTPPRAQPVTPLTIKRIKLFQRPRPINCTHPSQVPRRPPHNWSLPSYLNSYTMLLTPEEEGNLQIAELESRALQDASIQNRLASLQRSGRILSAYSTREPQPEHIREIDHHDHLVSAACQQAAVISNLKSSHLQGSKRIAKMISTYWLGTKGIQEKSTKEENKRMRALAKTTGKLVVEEWKKAVFHVREQRKQLRQEEETRLGRIHLDKILDKSGRILDAQQQEMTRATRSSSRDSSASVTMNEPDGETSAEESDDEEEPSNGSDSPALLQQDSSGLSQDHDIPEDMGAQSQNGLAIDEELIQAESHQADLPSPASQSPLVHGKNDDDDSDAELPGDLPFDLVIPRHSTSRESSGPSENVATPSSYTEPMAPFDDIVLHESATEAEGLPVDAGADVGSKNIVIATALEDNTEEHMGIDSKPSPVISNLPGAEIDHAGGRVDDVRPTADHVEGETSQHEDSDAEDLYELLPKHLRDFAATYVERDPEAKINPPVLLRGTLRPYQQSGMEWLASLHSNSLNGILADEMGLGKTIQTISLLAHLACDHGIWGPHLIIVPTSVLLNWEMEFKKFLPGFRILTYHGSTKRRKELRVGWNNRHAFNVCVTSYTLASRDAHIFKRKPWYYMILDEAHMIKNFKSQRWNTLLMFRSFRRLLLTGTPLQNNLTELWSLLQFLMSGASFVNLKEFGDWFANPLEKAIEMGTSLDEETKERVAKLHTVLRPYLLRRLKADVEKELPSKYEHIVMCRLSKRQRLLYDEFMSRAQTKEALASGMYQKIANILMQLRKVCNHPDLFEVRPIVTSFAMSRSAIADYEIQELLIRRRMVESSDRSSTVNMDFLGLQFSQLHDTSLIAALSRQHLDASSLLITAAPLVGVEPPSESRSVSGFRKRQSYLSHLAVIQRQKHTAYINALRCRTIPMVSSEVLRLVEKAASPIVPMSTLKQGIVNHLEQFTVTSRLVKSYEQRLDSIQDVVRTFAVITPNVVANDLPQLAIPINADIIGHTMSENPNFDSLMHLPANRLQIAFPDPSLLEYDCGKLQELARLLRERRVGGHRVLIFTQMTKILDILEMFLNFHGWLYLRLDGATKIEDRQYVTERFNADPRIFAFIASSRSGGVGINLTGADTVVFYDSDFNPQMDRQCEDRAHRIGQIRDVHIYRFISQHTVEESIFHKANQKRSLDDLVIQQGEFDWRTIFSEENVLTKALEEFEDQEDVRAARVAAREEAWIAGEEQAEFGDNEVPTTPTATQPGDALVENQGEDRVAAINGFSEVPGEAAEAEEEGSTADYMLAFVNRHWEFFESWKI
ncbi:hypothetical protein SISSUDRAFT_1058993 [Sistotremastrum suecicum HHB10207 ss-3]|uniref:DNA helicase n=1 Tax=Sistotremastrum suecicum HHB10207 ss-3 TaxID=1314776 RepID=A0A166GP53_9AGAM|nr:hypothetical protein SISSUDRAFT_1058993 [Sistotremastrum suecicum HHB10207 ss-3]